MTANAGLATGWSVGPNGMPGPLLRQCLEAAIAAPSIHNSQPWRFRAHEHGVDVLVDRSRRLDVIDPTGREMLLSVGAAVLNLRIAMLARGRMPVLRLLPVGPDAPLVARVAPGAQVSVTPTIRLLDRAIPSRHTNRLPFENRPVPPQDLADLADAARAEGAALDVVDTTGRDAILSIVRTAEARWRRSPRYWLELAEWTVRRKSRGDGIPPEALGPWSAAESMPLRDLGLANPDLRRTVARFESAPAIAVLRTPSDNAAAWVHAGQALERVLLTATARGLATTLLTQPLELPSLRALLNDASDRVAQA